MRRRMVAALLGLMGCVASGWAAQSRAVALSDSGLGLFHLLDDPPKSYEILNLLVTKNAVDGTSVDGVVVLTDGVKWADIACPYRVDVVDGSAGFGLAIDQGDCTLVKQRFGHEGQQFTADGVIVSDAPSGLVLRAVFDQPKMLLRFYASYRGRTYEAAPVEF